MKKILAAVLVASFAMAASAQTAAPAAAAAPAPAASAAKSHPCKDEAKAKGLKGDEAKKAVEQCRADHEAKKTACEDQVKDMKKGKERSAAVKACMAK